jgi:DNA polymerase I-like protein with 3'-5' exonuclease and polymerase domains
LGAEETPQDKSLETVMKVNIFGALEVFLLLEKKGVACRQEALSADSMKSSKLKRHLEKSRANLANNPRDLSDKKKLKRINYTSVNLNMQPPIHSLVVACKLQIGFPNAKSPIQQKKNQSLLFIPTNCI